MRWEVEGRFLYGIDSVVERLKVEGIRWGICVAGDKAVFEPVSPYHPMPILRLADYLAGLGEKLAVLIAAYSHRAPQLVQALLAHGFEPLLATEEKELIAARRGPVFIFIQRLPGRGGGKSRERLFSTFTTDLIAAIKQVGSGTWFFREALKESGRVISLAMTGGLTSGTLTRLWLSHADLPLSHVLTVQFVHEPANSLVPQDAWADMAIDLAHLAYDPGFAYGLPATANTMTRLVSIPRTEDFERWMMVDLEFTLALHGHRMPDQRVDSVDLMRWLSSRWRRIAEAVPLGSVKAKNILMAAGFISFPAEKVREFAMLRDAGDGAELIIKASDTTLDALKVFFSEERVRAISPNGEEAGRLNKLAYGSIFLAEGVPRSQRVELLAKAIAADLGMPSYLMTYVDHALGDAVLGAYHLVNPLAVLDSYVMELGDYKRREHTPRGLYWPVQAYFKRLKGLSKGWEHVLPGLHEVLVAMWERYFGGDWGGPKPVPFGLPRDSSEANSGRGEDDAGPG